MSDIIICDRCKGHGELQFDVGKHKSEYKYKTCDECGGSGRLIKKTFIKKEPFVPGNTSYRIF